MSNLLEWSTGRSLRRALPLLGLAFAACTSKPIATTHYDAGGFFFDAGAPPVCTVDCNTVPDAGLDAGYQASPVNIARVTPPSGPVIGGTPVQISGVGFMNTFADAAPLAASQSTLLVGGNPATDYLVISDTVAQFTTPPGLAGPADVVLTNPNGTVTCNGCFSYFTPVLLQSMSPAMGPVAGGTPVVLTGTGLTADMSVLFGDKSATSVSLDSSTGSLTAISPPAEQPGAVDVRVVNAVGTSSLRLGFVYQGTPRLMSASPAGGPLAGGTAVVLSGVGLSTLTSCSFGAVAGTQLLVQSDSSVEVASPPAAVAGAVDLVCQSPFGSTTLKRAFTYFDPSATIPALLGVSPTHGVAAGGNTVTVVGNALGSVTSVLFGAKAATIISSTANTLVVTVPPGSAHSVVAVGAGTLSLAQAYTYNLLLEDVRPSHGPPAGGTSIALDGQGFVGTLLVTVGGQLATSVSASTPLLLGAVTPPGGGGDALVRVSDASDPEDYSELPQGFAYDETLAVNTLVPPEGAIAGGTYVTAYGAGFAEGTVLQFGTFRAKDITVVDSHTITCHTPANAAGVVDVGAILDGVTATAAGAFTYFDPTNEGGGSTGGPLDGTLNVTVLDSTFTQYGDPVVDAYVLLGADPSTPFQGVTDANGQITFSDPAIVKAQTVSVSKAGYEMVTVVEQESQNITVYIGENAGTAGASGAGTPETVVSITGRVLGFKPGRPLASNEHDEARVYVAPASLFYVPPLGYDNPPLSEERYLLDEDGEGYLRVVLPGLYAVYAIYGIVNDDTSEFTPVLMGLHRGIEVSTTVPASNEDIVLDMHLDWSTPITISNPVTDPDTGGPVQNQVYSYLDLGAEGVVPLGGVTGLTSDLLYPGLPELDGSNFIFLNDAVSASGAHNSVFFVRQPGDPRQGITIGPMLGMVSIAGSSLVSAPVFDGTLSWTFGAGAPPDLTQVSIDEISSAGSIPLWNVILPGSDAQVSLPPTVFQSLIDNAGSGAELEVQITSDSEPRFDYSAWSYDDLGQLGWLGYTQASALYTLPVVDGGTPL